MNNIHRLRLEEIPKKLTRFFSSLVARALPVLKPVMEQVIDVARLWSAL